MMTPNPSAMLALENSELRHEVLALRLKFRVAVYLMVCETVAFVIHAVLVVGR